MRMNKRLKQRTRLCTAVLLIGLLPTGKAYAYDVTAASANTIGYFQYGYTGDNPDYFNRIMTGFNSSEASNSIWDNADGGFTQVICPNPTLANCNPGGLHANDPQLTLGSGSFPSEDNFTQPPPVDFTGFRADTNTGGVPFSAPDQESMQHVAQARLDSLNSGGAAGHTMITHDIYIGGPPSFSIPLHFTMFANPYLQVSGVQENFESASAALQTQIKIVDDNGQTVFLWTPGVTGGQIGVTSETVPFSLNQTLQSETPGTDQLFDPVLSDDPASFVSFTADSVGLTPAHYTLTLEASSVVTAAHAAVIPEPETYAMFLAGLGLLGWRMRRN